MRQFFAILVALTIAGQARAEPVPINETLLFIPMQPLWVLNTANGYGIDPAVNPSMPTLPEGMMNYIHLPDWIPDFPVDAVAVDLMGELLITQGPYAGICDITLATDGSYMALTANDPSWPNNPFDPDGIMAQTIEHDAYGGMRSMFYFTAPVTAGTIGIRWNALPSVASCTAFGVNLNVSKVYR